MRMLVPASLAVAVAAGLALSSCASPGYDEATSGQLRGHVVTVAEASAAGDWPTALAALDTMADELTAAEAEGRVDDERYRSIVMAMELVRQDLETAIDEAEDAAEQARLQEEQARLQAELQQLQEQQQAEDRQGKDDKGDDKGKRDKDEEDGDD
jgi:hypothetical protein